MRTVRELYLWGKKCLREPLEAAILCEEYLGADRKRIAIDGGAVPEEKDAADYIKAVEKRRDGCPLQYILGYAYFCGMKLKVKDGVLIPREDTRVLVEEAVRFIGDSPMTGYDLCAGTGAVALGIASFCPGAGITAAELYPVPMECLIENMKEYGKGRVQAKKLDVTKAADITGLDFIVSNPPYISRGELPGLQAEVRLEPGEALDGGLDGLDFYRAIVEGWKKSLRPGGLMAFEIGDTQGEQVAHILESSGFLQVRVIKDFNGLDRVVSALKE